MTVEEFQSVLSTVGDQPGVYLFKDESGRPIYVGKAISLRSRLRSYTPGPATLPKQALICTSAASLETIVTRSDLEAVMLEQTLIQSHHPRHNVSWRDNKSYPFLELTLGDAFPRVYFTRRRARKGGKLFGPFAGGAARRLQRVINQYFRVPSCKVEMDGKQTPCLYHHLGWCDAPCAARIAPEAYGELVRQVQAVLEGRTGDLVPELRAAMGDAAAREDFETAAALRDRLGALDQLQEDQAVIAPGEQAADVVGLARSGSFACIVLLVVRDGKLGAKQEFVVRRAVDVPDEELVAAFLEQHYAAMTPPGRVLVPCDLEAGELLERWLASRRGTAVDLRSPRRGLNRELMDIAQANARAALITKGRVGGEEAKEQLAALGTVLGLSRQPLYLEAVDLSHLHGEEAVGAVVVFREGLPSNREHRRYLIRTAKGGDDFAGMREVVRRRLARLAEEGAKLPDLLLLDGGPGQLQAGLAACADAGVDLPVIALAKREELVFRPGDPEPLRLPADAPALHLLQRARDEAHRYVNAYQRRRRVMGLRDGAKAARRLLRRPSGASAEAAA